MKASGFEPETYGLKVCSEGFFIRRKDYDNKRKTAVFPRFFAFSLSWSQAVVVLVMEGLWRVMEG